MNTHSLAVATFNVNGIGNQKKRARVFEWLKQKSESIILLQETHSTPEVEREWKTDWGGEIIFSHGQSNSTGVAILLGPQFTIENFNQIKTDANGRFVAIDLTVNNITYCLANYYGPNTDKQETLEECIKLLINKPPHTKYIIGGDWNAVLCNELDKGGNKLHKNKKNGAVIKAMMEELDMIDIFRIKNPGTRKYSHFNKTAKSCSRLDYFLISTSIADISASNIEHGFASDHSYVTLKITGENITQGRGYWKINNSYIKEPEYVKGIQEIIDYHYSNNYDSEGGVWDIIKIKIKEFSIIYGGKKKKDERERKNEISKNIETTKTEIAAQSENLGDEEKESLYDSLKELENEYNNIIKTELDGIIMRAKAQWVEEGEKSTRYFMNLEKSKGSKKSITKIITEEKREIKDSEGISTETVKFYKRLFSSRNVQQRNISEYLSASNNNSTVTQSTYYEIEQRLEIGELDKGLKNFNNNKSPGSDGLSSEFYSHFWDKIKPILFKLYEEAISRGSLSPSQRMGIIILIPKPDKDHSQLKNWRPITLLNIDYKLFTHIIKNRINKAIPQIITKQQTGFQKGKGTNVNITLMYLVLEHFHRNPDEGGYLLQIDFEKAFDSVEHNFLFQTMDKMGFGPYLIRLVKVAFAGCMSMILVNGNLTEPVYLQRGLHQGSPLSPLLFLIVGQILTNRCYNNNNIKGLCIEGVEIMMSLFADDTDTFLEADPAVLKAFIDELKLFGEASGCRCNIDKTLCILLGNATQAQHDKEILALGNIKIETEFKALGVHFNTRNFNGIVELNYEKKMARAEELVRQWGRRDLTVYGKVTIIKSLLLSQFIYLFVPLPRPPGALIKKIETLIYNFLWGVKRDKVKRQITTCSKDRGGLDMINIVDFIRSQKAKLINLVLDPKCEQEWKLIVINQLMGDIPIISIENNLVKEGRGFCKDLLQAGGEVLDSIAHSRSQLRNRCVWDNQLITDLGKLLKYPQLENMGILYATDFLDGDGTILNYNKFLNKFSIQRDIISQREYGNIKLALKRSHHDFTNIGEEINIKLIQDNTRQSKWQSTPIREKMKPILNLSEFAQLKKWEDKLNTNIDWYQAFFNIYDTTITNKLREFQYKCNYRLCTSKYMRKLMKIETESDTCHACNKNTETLEHQLIACPVTVKFKKILERKIKQVEPNYREDVATFVSVTHDSKVVNYLNIIAKFYINKKFRKQKLLWWEEYAWYARNFIQFDRLDEADKRDLTKITAKGEQLQQGSGSLMPDQLIM